MRVVRVFSNRLLHNVSLDVFRDSTRWMPVTVSIFCAQRDDKLNEGAIAVVQKNQTWFWWRRMADASTNNSSATSDKGAGEGMVLEECSEGSLGDCPVIVVILPLEIDDGEIVLAKAVLGNVENTMLSDAKLITTSKTPNQSDDLVGCFG